MKIHMSDSKFRRVALITFSYTYERADGKLYTRSPEFAYGENAESDEALKGKAREKFAKFKARILEKHPGAKFKRKRIRVFDEEYFNIGLL